MLKPLSLEGSGHSLGKAHRPKPLPYSQTIGRLRGVSILVVVIMHYTIYFPNALGFLGRSLYNGYYGVTAFFAISGFLITSNLIRRYGAPQNAPWIPFYVRRLARIVPLLGLILLLLLSGFWFERIPNFLFESEMAFRRALFHVLTLTYTPHIQSPVPWIVLWSLCIEEIFYLGYPVIAWALGRSSHVVFLLLGLVIWGPLYRLGGSTPYDVFFVAGGCFDAIALGALAALLASRSAIKESQRTLRLLGLIGICLMIGTYLFLETDVHFVIGPSLVGLGASLVLLASSGHDPSEEGQSLWDPLSYLGAISYELYLLHLLFFALIRPLIPEAILEIPGFLFALMILSLIVTSHFVARNYSEPLNQWIRKGLLR